MNKKIETIEEDPNNPRNYEYKGLAFGCVPVLVQNIEDNPAFKAKYWWCEPLLDVGCFICGIFKCGVPVIITGEVE